MCVCEPDLKKDGLLRRSTLLIGCLRCSSSQNELEAGRVKRPNDVSNHNNYLCSLKKVQPHDLKPLDSHGRFSPNIAKTCDPQVVISVKIDLVAKDELSFILLCQ